MVSMTFFTSSTVQTRMVCIVLYLKLGDNNVELKINFLV